MADLPARRSTRAEIEAFLGAAARVPALRDVKGRLIFAIDATMSRQPTWDRAASIQADMFGVVDSVGGLAVQLVWFRGAGEFSTSDWTVTAAALAARMAEVRCRSGLTQLGRVLDHAAEEARTGRIGALVYVGDAFEEDGNTVARSAAALALRGVPAFVFHEGDDANAAAMFQEVARLTKGVYARFDAGSSQQLRELLTAAAVYATGGAVALRTHADTVGGAVKRLAQHLGGR